MKIEISKETLEGIIDYIERVEVQIDGEWGRCQTLEELIESNDMPDFYDELKIISENTAVSREVRHERIETTDWL